MISLELLYIWEDEGGRFLRQRRRASQDDDPSSTRHGRAHHVENKFNLIVNTKGSSA